MTAPHSRSILVLGGARSGKSRYAEGLARDTGLDKFYLATGRAWDDEMRVRIDAHKADRAEDGWTTYEEPLDLIGALKVLDKPERVILVDCLTLWVTNLMMEDGRDADADGAALAASLGEFQSTVIFVSNEVGLGIVPENKMARAFRDHAGRLHQAIAAQAAEVYFVAAGLPLKMKG